MKKLIFMLILSMFVFSPVITAAENRIIDIKVRWEYPVPGDEDYPADLIGFRIFYGIESGSYTEIIDVPVGDAPPLDFNPVQRKHDFSATFTEGFTYFFAMTAYGDRESVKSNEDSFLVEVLEPLAEPPPAPQNVRIVLQ